MTRSRLSGWLGVDGTQWRVLVRAYLQMDLRAGGGASRPGEAASGFRSALPFSGLLFLTALSGVLMGIVGGRIPDLLVGMTFVTTYSAVNTSMLVLLDFSASILAPADFAVLAHRPVTSSTYFAARLTTVLVYVSLLAIAMSLVPAFTYGFWRGLGWQAAVAVLAAMVFCSVAATVMLNNATLLLLRFVRPPRIRRASATLQLLSASMLYAALYLASAESMPSMLQLSYERSPWLWINPAAWFAAWVPIAAGDASRAVLFAGAAAATLTMAAIPLTAGWLARDYATRVGEVTAAAEPARARRGLVVDVPGFGRNEARAIALLVRAQFRYDMRFRFGIFAIVPLLVFYLLMDKSGLIDPFAGASPFGGGMMHMAIMFMPLTLHGALHVSESWRAAWIFFATPASPARLVLGAKNFAAVFFLGGYIAFLAAIWSWFYDKIWHALVHAAALGLVAHLLLQVAVMLSPSLPFATEPKRAQESSRLFGLLFFGSSAAALFSGVLPFVYARPTLATIFFGILIAGTCAMEWVLHRRVAAAMAELEFRI
jgi:hypothetical protein